MRAAHLCKSFNGTVALDDVTFEINPGELVALVGHNGAGKSTLLGIAAGVLAPTSGTFCVAGRAAFVPAHPALYARLTAREVLHYFARLAGWRRPETARRLRALTDELELDALLDRPCAALSAGQRHTVDVARALFAEPATLLLDEPLSTLDARGVARLQRTLLAARSRGVAILYATHRLAEAATLCDRVLALRSGRLVGDGSVAAVCAAAGVRSLAQVVTS